MTTTGQPRPEGAGPPEPAGNRRAQPGVLGTVSGRVALVTGRPIGDGIGLTVNAVTPGYIATHMLATIPDKVMERLRAQIPVGRLGRPEEIARTVGFLACDESAYITGEVWAVNGGLDM